MGRSLSIGLMVIFAIIDIIMVMAGRTPMKENQPSKPRKVKWP